MTNYTYEQRKMIADYLENVLLKEYETFDASYELETGFSISTIAQAIDDLRYLKFKSIKYKKALSLGFVGQMQYTQLFLMQISDFINC